MQTLSKAFSIRWPFQAKFRQRKNILAVEDPDVAGLEIPRAIGIPIGSKWIVTLDMKALCAFTFSIVFYLMAAFLANEWLYLLSAGLLIACILGTLLPFIIIRSIAVDCWLPEHGVAADDANISILIRHHRLVGWLKFFIPLRAMRARVILARQSISGFQPHRDLGEQSIILDDIGLQTLLVLSVPHLLRGVYKMSHVTVCTSYPFGLVWWTRKVIPSRKPGHDTDFIVVYPRVSSMRGNFLLQIKGMLSAMGMEFSERLALTQSTSVRGLREFRVGDSLRHIHWPSSARQSKLLVREFDSETLPIFDLYLDLTANWASREQFELAVCVAHSLIQYGYERDILPELFLRPSIDSEELSLLMQDLPHAKAPLEMLSEILARVEPIPSNVPHPEIKTNREVIALLPSTERLLRGATTNEAVTPVLLIAARMNEAGEIMGHRAEGNTIATVYSYSDLEAL
jgi:hypothetical protein